MSTRDVFTKLESTAGRTMNLSQTAEAMKNGFNQNIFILCFTKDNILSLVAFENMKEKTVPECLDFGFGPICLMLNKCPESK